MKSSVRSSLLLLLTAMIWGLAFVAQDVAMNSVRAFTFNGGRMLLAALMLLAVCAVMDARAKKNPGASSAIPLKAMNKGQKKALWIGGVLCGLFLAVASSLQQIGLEQGASAGKAGFITALYIVMVPVAGLLFRRRVRWIVWPCVAAAIAGFWLL